MPLMLYKWEGSHFCLFIFNLISLESFKSSISFGSVEWFECFLFMALGVWFHFIFEGSFHLLSIEFILTHLDSSSSNSNEELLEKIAANNQIAMQATIACVNMWEYFTSTKLNEESGKLVTPDVRVYDILMTM